MPHVDTTGMSRGEVLRTLYEASRPLGLGFLQFTPGSMTVEDSEEIMRLHAPRFYFDYVGGRVMRVDLSNENGFDSGSFDRDNGQGAAERAIQAFRTGEFGEVREQQAAGVRASIADVATRIGEETTITKTPGVTSINLGLSDMAEHLRPAVERAYRSLE